MRHITIIRREHLINVSTIQIIYITLIASYAVTLILCIQEVPVDRKLPPEEAQRRVNDMINAARIAESAGEMPKKKPVPPTRPAKQVRNRIELVNGSLNQTINQSVNQLFCKALL